MNFHKINIAMKPWPRTDQEIELFQYTRPIFRNRRVPDLWCYRYRHKTLKASGQLHSSLVTEPGIWSMLYEEGRASNTFKPAMFLTCGFLFNSHCCSTMPIWIDEVTKIHWASITCQSHTASYLQNWD